MKTLILLIITFLATALNAQWEWQNPLPQGNGLVSVHFVDSLEGWTVGSFGTVMHTIDGGLSWDILNIGTTEELNDVFFVGRNDGWIVGYGLIYHTSDAGGTWNEQDLPVPLNCESVFFIDEDNGWIVGSNYTIIHTENGGESWEEQDSGMGSEYGWLTSVFFINEDMGWTCGWNNVILKTTDGGEYWNETTSGGNDFLSSVYFIDNSVGWVSGSGMIFKSTNGGNTWFEIASDLNGTSCIYFSDLLNGWTCGGYGIIYRSGDGGLTWEMMNSGTTISLYDMNIPAAGKGYAVGGFGQILSYNQENDAWEALTSWYYKLGTKLFFLDENEGWATGYQLQHTTDGGKTWVEQGPAPGMYINCVDFKDSLNGWTASDNQIYRTRDGGDSWLLQLDLGRGWDTSFCQLFFTDTLHGWALDFYGLLFHTRNGGDTWEEQFSGIIDIQQNAIYAYDSLTAWIAGGYGWISKTTNGGETWTAFTTGFQYSMGWDIQFYDAQHGWIIDDYGLLFTENGGLNWERISNNGGSAIHFINPDQGWMAEGLGGNIERTDDGGHTWVLQNMLTNASIFDVWFVDENNGWAIGQLGMLFHTDNGGMVGTEEFKVQSLKFKVECFPNPLSSVTTFKYDLAETASVSLKIYNNFGQLIDVIIDGQQSAGEHQVSWNAGHLPPGIYFYSLNAGINSASGKLIVARTN